MSLKDEMPDSRVRERPLLEMGACAERREAFLIIDEINRGNLSKILARRTAYWEYRTRKYAPC